MSERKYKYINFRSDTALNNLECKTLIEEGAKLFSLLRLTEEAKQYLKYNAKLAGVIEKW